MSKTKQELNRIFYDLVAPFYDKADGRRRPQQWLEDNIRQLAETTPAGSFLDVGSGTGYVATIALKYFKRVVALDYSGEMLKQIKDPRIEKVKGSAYYLPFNDGEFDAVCTFATLHHLEQWGRAIDEIYRVLRKGGAYYSDHDLDAHFYNRYKFLVDFFRRVRRPQERYSRFLPDAVEKIEDLYHESEVHGFGLPSDQLQELLKKLFSAGTMAYHYRGIVPLNKNYERGEAPLIQAFCFK